MATVIQNNDFATALAAMQGSAQSQLAGWAQLNDALKTFNVTQQNKKLLEQQKLDGQYEAQINLFENTFDGDYRAGLNNPGGRAMMISAYMSRGMNKAVAEETIDSLAKYYNQADINKADALKFTIDPEAGLASAFEYEKESAALADIKSTTEQFSEVAPTPPAPPSTSSSLGEDNKPADGLVNPVSGEKTFVSESVIDEAVAAGENADVTAETNRDWVKDFGNPFSTGEGAISLLNRSIKKIIAEDGPMSDEDIDALQNFWLEVMDAVNATEELDKYRISPEEQERLGTKDTVNQTVQNAALDNIIENALISYPQFRKYFQTSVVEDTVPAHTPATPPIRAEGEFENFTDPSLATAGTPITPYTPNTAVGFERGSPGELEARRKASAGLADPETFGTHVPDEGRGGQREINVTGVDGTTTHIAGDPETATAQAAVTVGSNTSNMTAAQTAAAIPAVEQVVTTTATSAISPDGEGVAKAEETIAPPAATAVEKKSLGSYLLTTEAVRRLQDMGINMQAGDVVDAETFKMWEEQLLDDAGLSVGQMRARMNALNAQTKITFEQATSPEAFRSRVRSGYYAVGDDPVARLKNFNLSDERVRINAISDQYALNRADSIAFRKTELEAQVIVSQNTLQAQALKSSADYLFKLIDNFAGDNPDELFRSASFRAAYESLQGISALALNMSLVELEASVKTQSSLQFRSWLGGWFGLVKDKVAFTALAFERNIAEAKASGSTAAAARVEAEKRMEPGANDLYNRYIGQ